MRLEYLTDPERPSDRWPYTEMSNLDAFKVPDSVYKYQEEAYILDKRFQLNSGAKINKKLYNTGKMAVDDTYLMWERDHTILDKKPTQRSKSFSEHEDQQADERKKAWMAERNAWMEELVKAKAAKVNSGRKKVKVVRRRKVRKVKQQDDAE